MNRPVGFTLDSSYRRPGEGPVVIAGSPLKLLRLSEAGRRIVEAIERGEPLPQGHEGLTRRLVDAGAIHPVPSAAAADPSTITVVLPTLDATPRFRPQRCSSILVDDASREPVGWPPPGCDEAQHRVVRLPTNGGPGAARNAALAMVSTPLVAFVDSDVDVDESTLLTLAGQLDTWDVAVVAPRVTADDEDPSPGAGALLRAYERRHSPLDLGAEPARVAPGTRVSYVPAAVLVCRTDAIRAVGGFDASLRYGEDVDLLWRLHALGERCRYEPSLVVRHRTRATWRDWAAQRFRYGTSAAPLARRHPGALTPVRISGWSAATWGFAAAGHPVVGLTIGTATTAALVRKLPDVPATESLRLAGLGHLYAGRLLAGTLVRAWWPVALLAAMCSRHARRAVIAAALATAASEARQHRGSGAALGPLRAGLLRLADDAAYGAGVWAGMARERTLQPIVPTLASWPGRRSGPVSTERTTVRP